MEDRRRYLTVAQVAEMWNVSTDKIYRDVKKGALPAYTVGGSVRVREADALAYGRLKPHDSTSPAALPPSL
jgi:excisionase family DNA binding protein